MPRKPLVAPTKKPIRIAAVRPNLGVESAYQRKLDALIDAMNRSVSRAILATYRADPPEMAQDESSPVLLRGVIARLSRDWGRRFDDFAASVGSKFAKDAIGSADRSFAAGLKKAGFTIDWKMTPAANDIMRATIAEQVNLIKSIPAEYLTQVQGITMRSVQVGRDMGAMARELEHQFGVTKRRAATIARSQSNIATASITRARQQELGIDTAIWLHSAGGRVPRASHVAMSGKPYKIAEGVILDGEKVWPGTAINCRCVSKSLIKGLE